MRNHVTHEEPGLVVTELFADPTWYGFPSKAEPDKPVKPDDAPPTSGSPEDKKET